MQSKKEQEIVTNIGNEFPNLSVKATRYFVLNALEKMSVLHPGTVQGVITQKMEADMDEFVATVDKERFIKFAIENFFPELPLVIHERKTAKQLDDSFPDGEQYIPKKVVSVPKDIRKRMREAEDKIRMHLRVWKEVLRAERITQEARIKKDRDDKKAERASRKRENEAISSPVRVLKLSIDPYRSNAPKNYVCNHNSMMQVVRPQTQRKIFTGEVIVKQ